MNTTREVVAPAMKAAAEDICGPDADRVFTSDTRDLMGFFVILKKLLLEVCTKVLRLHVLSCERDFTSCGIQRSLRVSRAG